MLSISHRGSLDTGSKTASLLALKYHKRLGSRGPREAKRSGCCTDFSPSVADSDLKAPARIAPWRLVMRCCMLHWWRDFSSFAASDLYHYHHREPGSVFVFLQQALLRDTSPRANQVRRRMFVSSPPFDLVTAMKNFVADVHV